MQERAAKNSLGGYRGKKLKTQEPDEEKLASADDNDDQLRNTKSELEESRSEVRQLGEEIRRLRQRESTLDAENKILKSQLLH